MSSLGSNLVDVGSLGLSSLRAASRYTTNNMGLRESPWGVPIMVVNSVDSFPHVRFNLVLARRNLISVSSSLSTMSFRISSNLSLWMVSKALLRSIPNMVNDSWYFLILAMSILCAKTMSVVDLLGLKPAWDADK